MTSDQEALLTTKELRERGMKPRKGEAPAKVEEWFCYTRRALRYFWRSDQAEPIKRRDIKPAALPATPENVLLAVWSVNRAAKRRRDAASACYSADAHGLARHHRVSKERYYGLKDSGIAWLAQRGQLTAVHRHGRLVVWEGGGFRFHSTIAPADHASLPNKGDDLFKAEAKPRTSREMRLVDAEALLSALEADMSAFARLQAPRFARRPCRDVWLWEDEYEDGDCDF